MDAHNNQHQHDDPIAVAPYNFVSLPDSALPLLKLEDLRNPERIDAALPDHDAFLLERKSGYFEVKLETLSPLYIRSAFTTDEFEQMEKEKVEPSDDFRKAAKNKPDFYYTLKAGQPVIPGSSVRGMLRNIVSVITYSKFTGVTQKRMFYRNIRNRAYQSRMAAGAGTMTSPYSARPQGGFWHQKPDGSAEIEPCTVLRVQEDLVAQVVHAGTRKETLYTGAGPNDHPQPQYQHRQLFISGIPTPPQPPHAHRDKFLSYQLITQISEKFDSVNYPVKATLILTGPMNNKHMAFLFVKQSSPTPITVLADMVKEFHDDDQLTDWQKTEFDHGKIKEGDPVFYLVENNQLTFFGRAQMFRLPYLNTAFQRIPEGMRKPEEIDYTEAMFGFTRNNDDLKALRALGFTGIKQGEKIRSYTGRISVTDATLNGTEPKWLSSARFPNEPIVPRILATPKPTSTKMYLTQEGIEDTRRANHYDSPNTYLRGHKFYWHQGERNAEDLEPIPVPDPEHKTFDENGRVKDSSSQHTQFNPLAAHNSFAFRVYFDNLTDAELGALAWALQPKGNPAKKYAHSLGMGKPLGMGAVSLTPTLHLIDRAARYKHLFTETGWALEESIQNNTDYLTKFEHEICRKLNLPQNQRFSDVPRIAELLHLLEWKTPADHPESKQYFVGISQEGILPKALGVDGSPVVHAPSSVIQTSNKETGSGELVVGQEIYLRLYDIASNGDFILFKTEFGDFATGRLPKNLIKSKNMRPGDKKNRIHVRVVKINKQGQNTEYECEEI
jgi:CRISPR-associated protein (TIGR03986 family)